jgi:hypothetical protein
VHPLVLATREPRAHKLTRNLNHVRICFPSYSSSVLLALEGPLRLSVPVPAYPSHHHPSPPSLHGCWLINIRDSVFLISFYCCTNHFAFFCSKFFSPKFFPLSPLGLVSHFSLFCFFDYPVCLPSTLYELKVHSHRDLPHYIYLGHTIDYSPISPSPCMALSMPNYVPAMLYAVVIPRAPDPSRLGVIPGLRTNVRALASRYGMVLRVRV